MKGDCEAYSVKITAFETVERHVDVSRIAHGAEGARRVAEAVLRGPALLYGWGVGFEDGPLRGVPVWRFVADCGMSRPSFAGCQVVEIDRLCPRCGRRLAARRFRRDARFGCACGYAVQAECGRLADRLQPEAAYDLCAAAGCEEVAAARRETVYLLGDVEVDSWSRAILEAGGVAFVDVEARRKEGSRL